MLLVTNGVGSKQKGIATSSLSPLIIELSPFLLATAEREIPDWDFAPVPVDSPVP